MYVYVASFSNRQGLIKIGKAKDPAVRLRQLESHHGTVCYVRTFKLGADYTKVERELHKLHKESNVPLLGRDGGTEFFTDGIRAAVLALLEARVAGKLTPLEAAEAAEQEARQIWSEEQDRCSKFVARVIRRREPHTPAFGRLSPCFTARLQISGALDLGFDEQQVLEKAVAHNLKHGFITVGRLRLALLVASQHVPPTKRATAAWEHWMECEEVLRQLRDKE